jgi:hypothetical protein
MPSSLKRAINVPFGQHYDFLEAMSKCQGTLSILMLLNHRSHCWDNHVACAIESSVTSSCRSPILALEPSKD